MNSNTRLAKRNPLIPNSWVSAMLAGHSALGLAFSAAIYLICLTGSVVVFAPELQRWEQPAAPRVTAIASDAIDRGIAMLREKAPEDAAQSVTATLPSPTNPYFLLSAGGHEGVGGEGWFGDASGRAALKVRHEVSDFLLRLHVDLHLPFGIGSVIVALAGLSLLALVISGILSHSRMIKDAFRLRKGRSARLDQADLHNRIGTWGLPFHFVIALTGAFLGVFIIVFGSLAATTYKGDMFKAFADLAGPFVQSDANVARGYKIPSSAPFIASAKAAAPDLMLQSIDVQQPGTKSQLIGIGLRNPRSIFLGERIVYDSEGRKIFVSDTINRSIGQRALFAMRPLHFGWFGGIFIKLAYGLLGLSMCAMTASGLRIWLMRRRDKGRPSPIMERLWSATIWGQPLALTLSAIPPFATDMKAAPVLGWAAGTMISYALACLPVAQARLNTGLRIATAATLSGLALMHAGINAVSDMSAVDPVSWAVDAALLVTGLLVGLPMLRRYCAISPKYASIPPHS